MAITEVVLITGAAGAIGRATVTEFLDRDFAVIGFDRDPGVVTVTTREGYAGVMVDLQDENAVEKAIADVRGCGELAHVIAIAGGALPGEPESRHDPALLSVELFAASVTENLTTQFITIQKALPWMRARQVAGASIACTSSWNALTGCGMPAYSAAKAGLIGMTHALAGPLGAEGIRINVVAPGTVRTPRTERLWGKESRHFETLEQSSLLGRLGEPADVARTFAALATLLTHVTGQVVVVDGGQMLHHC
jgi:NAD(P)-dependent dehydrogenase (short-subunit alcohol dehydrogenase family)